MTFAPPGAAKICCVWRKTNLTQSGCPTTSLHSVIPGRNNRGTLCRRPSRVQRLASKTLEQDSYSQNDCLAKRLGNQQTLARGSYFPPQGFAQVLATEVDEAVAVCLTRPLWSGCSASVKRLAQRNVRSRIGRVPSDIPSRNISRTRSCWTRRQE